MEWPAHPASRGQDIESELRLVKVYISYAEGVLSDSPIPEPLIVIGHASYRHFLLDGAINWASQVCTHLIREVVSRERTKHVEVVRVVAVDTVLVVIGRHTVGVDKEVKDGGHCRVLSIAPSVGTEVCA